MSPNSTKRRKSIKKRFKEKSESRRRKLQKSKASTSSLRPRMKNLMMSLTSSKSKMNNSRILSKNCSRNTTILDLKTSSQIRKFSKCNINYCKDCRSFSPRKKPAKMHDMNKPLCKISGICSTTKSNL